MIETATAEPVVAGFWRRLAAGAVDALAVGIVATGLWIGISFPLGAGFFWLAYPVYCSVLERSTRQATAGKLIFRLRTVDLDGQPLTTGRAFARNFLKYVSAGSFGAGFLIAGFTPDHQAVHDLMAGTLVVKAVQH
jgi:uncharacterized RDD family membrane protein YckC